MLELAHKKQLTSTVYATPLTTLTTALGLSIRVSMFGYITLLTGTSSACGVQGRLERARAETVGAEQRVLKRREFPGVVRVNEISSACLGYPLSVFNKNSKKRI